MNPKELLNDWVLSLPRKDYQYISPSSLGSCPRVHYYKLKGIAATTPPTPAALLNFQVGFLWEEIWEKALKWSEVEYRSQETFIDPAHNIGGTCDFLIKPDQAKDEWEIWDSKTMGSKWFWYTDSRIKKGDYDELKEEFGYIIQQAVYIWLARKSGYNVTKARLAYISKDDGFVGKVTTIELTPEIEKTMLERIDYLNECLKTDTVPDCECEGWKVGYCDMGRLKTQERNKTGKLVNTECCGDLKELDKWRKEVKETK